MEGYQSEVGGFVGVATASEGGLNALTAEDVVKDHLPLLETQEEEEVKVGCVVKGHDGSAGHMKGEMDGSAIDQR